MDRNNPFTKQKLRKLGELLKRLNIKIPEQDLYDAAVAITRFVCVKELRQYKLNNNVEEVKNGR